MPIIPWRAPSTRQQNTSSPSKLLQTLIAAQLVDEFRVWIYPVVLGKGKRLFEEGVPTFGLTLVESRSTSRGILINTYRPAGPLPDMSAQPDNPSDAELARRRKLRKRIERFHRKSGALSREYVIDPLEILFAREVMRTSVVAILPKPPPTTSATF
jgi:hypothetical protein